MDALEYNCQATFKGDTKPAVIHVGDLFKVSCKGQSLKIDPNSEPKEKYLLKIIEAIESKEGFELVATSYKPGDHSSGDIILTTPSKEALTLKGISFKVESLIEKENPKPEGPYGPASPSALGFPMIYLWGLLLAIVFGLSIGILFGVRGTKRRNRLKKLRLMDEGTVINPSMQFHSNLRGLLRKLDFEDVQPNLLCSELLNFWNLYLTRQFYIAAFDLKPNQIQAEFVRRNQELLPHCLTDFHQIQREFAKTEKAQGTRTDLMQLIQRTRNWVDLVDRLEMRGIKSGKNRP